METNKRLVYLHSAIFLAGVAVIAWYFNYAEIAQLGPFSLHNWRQADSASLAMCYYENGMHFFQPKVHLMLGGANAAVGEFPILYYLAAALYHVFGPHDVILRLLVFGCFTAGLWAWSKMLLHWVGDWTVSLALPWAFYGSPLLAFYGFNYLPNPAGLGLALVGAYGLLRYWKQPSRGRLIFTGAFFMAAALIKVSLLVVPLAATAAAGWFYFIPKGGRERYFPDTRAFWHWTGVLAIILLTTAAWYFWANAYNRANQSGLLMTYIMPIWEMPKSEIERYAREIYEWYHNIYFNKFTILAFLILLPALLIMPWQFPRPAYAFTVFTLLGSLAFLVLFYNQILVHHYYIIDIMPLVMAVFSLTAWRLKNWLPAKVGVPVLSVALSVFAFTSLTYGKQHLTDYYGNDQYIAPFNRSFAKKKALHAFMAEKGLAYDATFAVVVPDPTPNVNLYYLNLKGWTIRPDQEFGHADLERFAQWRANILVICDAAYLSRPDIKPWLAHPIGVFDGTIYFYDMKPFWK